MKRGFTAAALGLALAGGVAYFNAGTPALVHGPAVCDVTISTPAPDRLNTIYIRSGESLDVTITGKTSRCKGATVSFFKSENGAAESAQGTTTADGTTGTWTKNLTLTNAVSTQVFARMTGGGRTTFAARTFSASTALPKVMITAPSATANGVLNVVASQRETGCGSGGNIHVVGGEPGWVADSDCAANAQVPTSFTVTGANGGTVAVTYQGVSVFSSAVSSTPQTFTPTLTLTDLTRGNLVFSSTNGSGTTSITLLTRVEAAIPPRPNGPDGGTAYVYRIIDARAATVEMDYQLPAIPVGVDSASIALLWTTSTVVGPGGDGGYALLMDGGMLFIDGGFDIGALLGGRTVSGQTWSTRYYDPRKFKMANGSIEEGNGCNTLGNVLECPDDCVLYDPSENPQIWHCRGSLIPAGGVRTATFHLPPLNLYYLWPVTKY